MNFCKECGHPMKPESSFCSECGTSRTENDVGAQPSPISTSPSPSPPENKQSFSFKDLTKKQKIYGLSVAIALIVLFSFHQFMSTFTSEERVVDSFKTALLEKDSAKLMSLLHSNDPRVEIHEEGVTSIIQYVHENPSYYESLINDLDYQVTMLNTKNERGATDELEPYHGFDSVFTLTKQGKTALFYDRYKLNVLPFYVEVGTNYEDAVISINSEVVTTATSYDFYQEMGPFMPGMYEFKSEYSSNYAMLEESIKLPLFYDYNNYAYVDLSLYGDYVTIFSDYEHDAISTKVFINNEETSFTLEDAAGIGPMPLDETISVYAELTFPWGTVQTEETMIGSSSIDLVVEDVISEEDKEMIVGTAHQFGEQLNEAVQHQDLSKINVTNEEYLNELQADYILDYYDGYTYTGGFFNPEEARLLSLDDERLILLPLQYVFEAKSYDYDETYETSEEYEARFSYDQEAEKWVLTGHDYLGYYNYFYQTAETVQLKASE